MSETLSPGAVPTASARPLWLIGGGIAVAVLTVGAAFALRGAGTEAPAAASVPAAQSLSAGESLATTSTTPPAAKAPAAKPAKPAPAPVERVAKAPTCVGCGVVESVRAVTRKGEGSGVGAVAGGVVGAVIGNQVGGGDGRKVATVLGAVGGGFAGNEIEKRSKSTTVQVVSVRMDDGTLRTVEQAQAPQVGTRVQIEGKTLKALPARG